MLDKPKRKNDESESLDTQSTTCAQYLTFLLIVLTLVITVLLILEPVIGNVFSNISPCLCLRSNL